MYRNPIKLFYIRLVSVYLSAELLVTVKYAYTQVKLAYLSTFCQLTTDQLSDTHSLRD